VVTLFPPQQMQPMYATMPWAPPASDSQFPAWENGGFWMQCYPMPYPPHFQGREAPEDLYLTGLGSRFTTDWVGTNLVRGSTPDRSNRSTPTSQTGLSKGRPKFVQCAKNIASRRRRTNQCRCKLILRRLQPLRLCKLKTGKEKLKMHKRDR